MLAGMMGRLMPPKKKQKTDDGEAAAEGEEVAEGVETEAQVDAAEVVVTESEQDAAADKRPKLKEPVRFLLADTTPNVMPATVGGMLLACKDAGLCHLCAGARASVGVTAGRYAFEVKAVELFGSIEGAGKNVPKVVLRVGFSTKGSSLLLGGGKDNICFDESGALIYDKGPVQPSGKPKKDAIMFSNSASVVVVLNLDEQSPNANTISLFCDGKRVCQPEPLPDALRGQALYPTVTFRSVTVHTNFDLAPEAPLAFTCRMVGDAAAVDTVVTEEKTQAPEVIFPIFLPDKGTFDWCDWFLKEKGGMYTELSDRSISDWALKSGLKNTKAQTKRHSADKPDVGFAIAGLDDGSAKELLVQLSAMQNRSYVVMEVRGNLLKEERATALKKWKYGPCKKVAQVMIGIPEQGFRTYVLEAALAEKQAKIDKAFEQQQAEKAKKRLAARTQRQIQQSLKKAAKIRKKMAEDKKRKQQEDEAKDEVKEDDEGKDVEAKEEGKEGNETKEEATKQEDEVKEEDEEDEDAEEAEKEPEAEEELSAPVATLSPVELQTWFRKMPLSDLSEIVTSAIFTRATLPHESEGFDEVRYTWAGMELAEDELKRWVTERKLNSKIEDLQPSAWFKEKWEHWQRDLQAWHVTHMEFKDPNKKKDGSNPFAKAAPAKPQKKSDDINSTEMDVEDDKDPIQALEDELDREEVDIFGLEDICCMDSEGAPLFSNFAFEDWALLSLRFELHLLVHAFRHDAKDPERTGIHPEHLPFYYNRYYKKALNPKNYGVDTVEELIDLVKDTALADSRSKVVESMVADDLESNDIFVKLTEENRRDRQRRIDTGDESAKLKFSRPAAGANTLAGVQPGDKNPMSKAGAMSKAPVPVGSGTINLGQKAKAATVGPSFTPKQQAWGGSPPKLGGGPRPNWGQKGGLLNQMNSWGGGFFGGGGGGWKGW